MGKKLGIILAVLLILLGLNYFFGFADFLITSSFAVFVTIVLIGIMVVINLHEGWIRWFFVFGLLIMAVPVLGGGFNPSLNPPINILGLTIDLAGLFFLALGITLLIYHIKHKPWVDPYKSVYDAPYILQR